MLDRNSKEDCSLTNICLFLGFNGTNCENNIDDCGGNLCQNGGKCRDGINTYTCDCPPNWTGEYCLENVDECAVSSPCQNHGTCRDTEGGYECICVNGFSGRNCEINKDDCALNPCLNGGTCVDKIGKYECECPPGKTGLICHLDDQCYNNPCKVPGARCDTNKVTGQRTCTCPPGLKGENCDEDIDECASLSQNVCEHDGICVNTHGSYKCSCPKVRKKDFQDKHAHFNLD